ncbi:MAG: hypothetical protein KAH32_03035 [Chlamydiia bacterium]|nr:hypothetical protein [Chlamydiia bacterium]
MGKRTYSKRMIGLVFGRLTVIAEAENRSPSGSIVYGCLCFCGVYKYIDGVNLRRGCTKSCGCLQEEYKHICDKKGRLLHGHTKSKVLTGSYKSWLAMRRRCTDPKSKDYKYYSEKGVTVCTSWLKSYQAFYKDMGDRPDGLTLDRVDNDKGYSKSNCRWATRLQQVNNSSIIRLLSFKGESKSVTEWSRALGIPRARISTRLNQLNWSVERSLTTTKNGKSNE